MEAVKSLLEGVAQLADEYPEAKGLTILGMAAIAAISLMGRIAGRLRRKSEEGNRVRVNIDAPPDTAIAVKINGEQGETDWGESA